MLNKNEYIEFVDQFGDNMYIRPRMELDNYGNLKVTIMCTDDKFESEEGYCVLDSPEKKKLKNKFATYFDAHQYYDVVDAFTKKGIISRRNDVPLIEGKYPYYEFNIERLREFFPKSTAQYEIEVFYYNKENQSIKKNNKERLNKVNGMFEVTVTKINDEKSNLVGLANLVVDGKFAFDGIKLVKYEGEEKGYFVSMPEYKTKDGGYVAFFHPCTKIFKQQLDDAIDKAYRGSDKTCKVNFGEGESVFKVSVEALEYGNTKGNVALFVQDAMVCDTIRVKSNDEGTLFVAMPTRKNSKEEFVSICNPITADFRAELYEDILNKRDISAKVKLNSVSRTSREPEISYNVKIK